MWDYFWIIHEAKEKMEEEKKMKEENSKTICYIGYEQYMDLVNQLAKKLQKDKIKYIWGVPKNGNFVALSLVSLGFVLVDTPEKAEVIVDDLIDSGTTRNKFLPKRFEVLLVKTTNQWINWWFEKDSQNDIEDSVIRMLEYINENPKREGLIDTPKRVVKTWNEMFKGYNLEKKPKVTVFPNNGDGIKYDEMIIDIGTFSSFCEHHILPFYGKYYFGYIPNKKILGLSKVARVVEYYSSKLQIQERLVKEILDELENLLEPIGMGLVMKGTHMCKTIRGIKNDGIMITNDLRGAFKNKAECRAEFINFTK